jgi:hypothetical protein
MMMVPAPPIPPVANARYIQMGKDAMRESKSKRTRAAYASDWKMFSAWCDRHHERALPATAATVVAYLSFMAEAGRKIATMSRALVSINLAHQAAQCQSPVGSLPVREASRHGCLGHGAAETCCPKPSQDTIFTVGTFVRTLGRK